MKAPWRIAGRESWATRVALSPLAPLEFLYGLGAAADRVRYERGLARRRRVDAKVVSVGGLVVGGAGKTPLASWVAEQLHRRGSKVALLSRGYGRRTHQAVTIVSDGRVVLAGPEQAGDEPLMLAGQAAGVPVIVSQDRALAALRAISLSGAEVLVLDDGFQHYRLARDLDLVAIDAAFGFGNGHLLPRGALREGVRALGRANAIAEVGGSVCPEVEAQIAKHAPGALRFRAERRPVSLRALGGRFNVGPGILRGMKVGMVAGIARPQSLRTTLEGLGAQVIAERVFRDHHRYRARDLRGLAQQADVWITTEKDAGKILPGWVGTADVRVLGVRIAVPDANRVLDWIEEKLDLHPSVR